MAEDICRSPAFDDALQNMKHALKTEDPVRELTRVLASFRDEHREEVLAEGRQEEALCECRYGARSIYPEDFIRRLEDLCTRRWLCTSCQLPLLPTA